VSDLLKRMLEIRRGEYWLISVDGAETLCETKPHLNTIYKEIGADCCDSVMLRFPDNGKDGIVMLVDDTGMIDGKPVNSKATELYHTRCKPGTIHAIHGDVAIVNDEDFA
jgi:hypothetical protein